MTYLKMEDASLTPRSFTIMMSNQSMKWIQRLNDDDSETMILPTGNSRNLSKILKSEAYRHVNLADKIPKELETLMYLTIYNS